MSRLVYRKGADFLGVIIPDVCSQFPTVDFIIGKLMPYTVRYLSTSASCMFCTCHIVGNEQCLYYCTTLTFSSRNWKKSLDMRILIKSLSGHILIEAPLIDFAWVIATWTVWHELYFSLAIFYAIRKSFHKLGTGRKNCWISFVFGNHHLAKTMNWTCGTELQIMREKWTEMGVFRNCCLESWKREIEFFLDNLWLVCSASFDWVYFYLLCYQQDRPYAW